LKVLLSEGSSLTSRETITALGPSGHELDVMDPDPLCLSRFSRWVRRVVRCPPVGSDPEGYVDAVLEQLGRCGYDVLLPTHEQAYLFAARRERIPREVGLAVAAHASFARVQSKLAFAQLLDELRLPQPRWERLERPEQLEQWRYPYWLKAAYSTAGQGVRQVGDERERAGALAALRPVHGGVLVQAHVTGSYGQVQALFDHGRLIAAHTCLATAGGMGGSAAARVGVDHPSAREHAARIGAVLAWHGGLTLDYLWSDDRGPLFLECNPRTVEPGNAVASRVPIPELQLRLSAGEHFSGPPVIGRPGVRTHSLIAICMSAAARTGRRRAVLREVAGAVSGRGCYRGGREILTPALRDPASVPAIAYVLGRLLVSPGAAAAIAAHAVGAYSISAEALETI
jgi:glutathione synthase/RimK-type ligase-like ATP-grasp enzyme